MGLLQHNRPSKGNPVDRFVQGQIRKHAVPLATAGAGLAGVGGTIGYLAGRNSVYDKVFNEATGEYQAYTYMAEFGYVAPKLGKLRKGIRQGMEKIASSGNLVSGDSATRKKTMDRLTKLKTLKQEYA